MFAFLEKLCEIQKKCGLKNVVGDAGNTMWYYLVGVFYTSAQWYAFSASELRRACIGWGKLTILFCQPELYSHVFRVRRSLYCVSSSSTVKL